MESMTARQPRRARRRVAPAGSLPRPVTNVDDSDESDHSRTVRRNAALLHHREHHVTKDYSHVHRDLLTVAVVGTVVMGFIVLMNFVVS